MSLECGATFNGLRVCPTCGWPMAGPYEEAKHRNCPYLVEGHAANLLAAQLPSIDSTKFGYGDRRITFNIDKDFSIGFTVGAKAFAFERMFLFNGLTAEQIEGLVSMLASWRKAYFK